MIRLESQVGERIHAVVQAGFRCAFWFRIYYDGGEANGTAERIIMTWKFGLDWAGLGWTADGTFAADLSILILLTSMKDMRSEI